MEKIQENPRSNSTKASNGFWSSRQIRGWVNEWNQENKFNILYNITMLKENLTKGDKEGDNPNIKTQIMEDLSSGCKVKESIIKQIIRIKLEVEGNADTKFFHQFIQFRWRINFIHGVNHYNSLIEDPEALKDHFC